MEEIEEMTSIEKGPNPTAMVRLKDQLEEGRRKIEISEDFDFRDAPFHPRIYKDLEGAIDLHIHSIPDGYPRLLDDIEVAAQAKAVKMRAIVLKCHVSSSPDRAYMAQRAVGGGIEVYGIICLNTPVGGMNPEAVKMAIRMGAKGVWMPSHWSAYDVQYMKRNRSLMGGDTIGSEIYEKTETILDSNGKMKHEAKDILRLVAEHDIMLSTGHLSLQESHLLLDEAKTMGIKKLLVHTVNYHVMGYPLEDQEKLVEKGAFLEYGFTSLPAPLWEPADPKRRITLDNVVKSIRTVGIEHCVLTTDSGQITSPPPIECMRLWGELLKVKGFGQQEIDVMMKTNPARLLGL